MTALLLSLQFEFIFLFFYFLSCLIAVARTSNTVLPKSSENGHPCLVPDLRVNAFSFSPLSMLQILGIFFVDNHVICKYGHSYFSHSVMYTF